VPAIFPISFMSLPMILNLQEKDIKQVAEQVKLAVKAV
jgi:hypothetical protein